MERVSYGLEILFEKGIEKELFLSTTALDTNKSCLMNPE